MLRGDLIMSEGKANAQAGHAYTDALMDGVFHTDPDIRSRALAYASLRPNTKVCLDGGSEASFRALITALEAEGIPHVLIIDEGHIEAPHFDGSPTMTAIGIGPLTKTERPKLLRRLSMWTGGARTRAEDQPKIQSLAA